MSAVIETVVLNVADSRRAADFWCRALDYAPQPHNPEFLVPTSGPGTRLHLDSADKTHLDLWVDRNQSNLQSEVERFVSLGAQRVDWKYGTGADHVVLADTEGNRFCLIP